MSCGPWMSWICIAPDSFGKTKREHRMLSLSRFEKQNSMVDDHFSTTTGIPYNNGSSRDGMFSGDQYDVSVSFRTQKWIIASMNFPLVLLPVLEICCLHAVVFCKSNKVVAQSKSWIFHSLYSRNMQIFLHICNLVLTTTCKRKYFFFFSKKELLTSNLARKLRPMKSY